MAHERVKEAGQLPCAKMAGEDEDAFAEGVCLLEVLQTLVTDMAGAILRGVPGHATELGEVPAEMKIEAAENALMLGGTKLRQGESKIGESDMAQTGVEVEDESAEGGAEAARDGTRQQTDEKRNAANGEKLEEAADGRLRHNR